MSKRPLFALIDCNNFFVSCERVFRPDLEGKPVVVLSSNDGCAVSRSNEAKALGIPMGAPAFKYRELFEKHGVVKFSANFDLYGDFSRRITAILTSVTPRIEIYSVDESFLDLSELSITDYGAWGRTVRERILRWTGIPVSIGIAPSKTLAKLASEHGKKTPDLGGVLDLAHFELEKDRAYLDRFPVGDVWGVGWRLSPRLRAEGVSTAYDLAHMQPKRAQQLMGIRGRQMVAELNGLSCFPLEREGKPAQSIAATRTFGEDTNDTGVLEAAIASFAANAAFKLRRSHQLTRRAALFMTTNKHKPGYQSWNRELRFSTPTADTGYILTQLTTTMMDMYRSHHTYHRAGIVLYDFAPEAPLQSDLLGTVDLKAHDVSVQRMQAIDAINSRFGKHTVYHAAEGLGSAWKPRQQLRSPRYTTHIAEIPTCITR